jgi:hypothetical protein
MKGYIMQHTKETTLAALLGDPDNQALFAMDNVEEYKGYDIYDQDGKTLATKLINGGVQCFSLNSVGNLTRQALRSHIDTL